jgi:hypothetical protein
MPSPKIRTCAAAAVALTIAAAPYLVAQSKMPVINVTVQYTGKSKVTEQTPIWVYLFNTPNANAQTAPLAVKRLAKNGGVVQFEYGGTEQVYVFVSLDTKGGYDPTTGPPEAGSPIGNYSTDGKTAAAVKLTPATNIKITFNDSVVFTP